MNKQKKRAISRGKFERVHGNPFEVNYSSDSNFMFSSRNIGCIKNNFIYWREWDKKNGYRYFRKSIQEALS